MASDKKVYGLETQFSVRFFTVYGVFCGLAKKPKTRCTPIKNSPPGCLLIAAEAYRR